MTYADPYNDPYVIEDANGDEVATTTDPVAAYDAARHLINSGEQPAPLVIRSRLTGDTREAVQGPRGVMFYGGMQGGGRFR